MRQILFRGLRTDGKGWVEGDLIQNSIDSYGELHLALIKKEGFLPVGVIPSSVGQFVGVVDKDGKKIYDGDTVSDGEESYVVEWGEPEAGFYLFQESTARTLYFHGFDELTVIGNIHEGGKP